MRIGTVLIFLVVCAAVTWVVGTGYGHDQCVAGVYAAAERDGVFIIDGKGQPLYVVRRVAPSGKWAARIGSVVPAEGSHCPRGPKAGAWPPSTRPNQMS
jgi:hypothetical protein